MDSPTVIEPVEFIQRVNVTSDHRVRNIAVNAGRNLPSIKFKHVCICASGPSLADHIEDIRARQLAGWSVAAMNGSYNFLLDHDIVADYFFMVDARPVNLDFVGRAHEDTTFVIASQCQPEIFEALADRKVMLWQMFHDSAGANAIREATGGRHQALFVGSLNVGQSCLTPLWALGYLGWHLFGFDGSMRGDEKHAFHQKQNDGEEVQEYFWPVDVTGGKIPGVTKSYLATPTMAHAAQQFPEKINYFRRLGVNIEIFGEGMIPDMVAALSSAEGAVTVSKAEDAQFKVPAPNPRRGTVEKLPIVFWKWQGHIPYTADDVNIMASQVDRWLDRPHEFVCITDNPDGIDGNVRTIPLWREQFEHGRDWHRVKIFSEEMADLIGPRFVSMDMDTVVCGKLDPLFDNDHPFMAWRDPNRDQYCTAMFMMDAGAYPHVWEMFDPDVALKLRRLGVFGGYDQAWVSYVLPGMPRWTARDGVLSFRVDILKNHGLHSAPLPEGARVVNFHGKHNPRDPEVQEACPWIKEYWK